MNIQAEINKVLLYFHYFKYSPSIEEIYAFFPFRINKSHLHTEIKRNRLYLKKKYHLTTIKKKNISIDKLRRSLGIITLLSLIPLVKFIGISGSVAMMNANEPDDIDIFIVTHKQRLWTTRFITILILSILNIRRKRTDVKVRNKICTNLWFDESDLYIPKYKQSLFTAHEIIQLKPVVDKNNTYEKFINTNQWIKIYLPNSKYYQSSPEYENLLKNIKLQMNKLSVFSVIYFILFIPILTISMILYPFELCFKKIQLLIINRHKTKEIITNTQLWFFPNDFEKKLRKKKLI